MDELGDFDAVDEAFGGETTDRGRVLPLVDDVLLSKHLADADVLQGDDPLLKIMRNKVGFQLVRFHLVLGAEVVLEFLDSDVVFGLSSQKCDMFPTLPDLARDFKYSFLHYENQVGWLPLGIHSLASDERPFVKGIEHPLDLVSSPVPQERDLLEEGDLLLHGLLLDLLEHSLVVLPANDCEYALVDTLYRGSPRLVVQQGQLSE